MKLYDFYKSDCAPCYVLNRMFLKIGIPENIELIKMNVADVSAKEFAKQNGIKAVPALMFEDGRILTGHITEESLIEFLKG